MKTDNPKTKILVIDDDPDFRKIVTIMLESGSYSVITAQNPQVKYVPKWHGIPLLWDNV